MRRLARSQWSARAASTGAVDGFVVDRPAHQPALIDPGRRRLKCSRDPVRVRAVLARTMIVYRRRRTVIDWLCLGRFFLHCYK